jgi:hypothetical protein
MATSARGAAPANPNDLATKSYVDTAVSSASQVAVNAQTGSYTLALSDAGCAVEVNDASASTVTVPLNATVAFPIGTVIEVAQIGAGQITVAAASGVTLQSAGSLVHTRVQFSAVSLRKRGTDTWLLVGDLA